MKIQFTRLYITQSIFWHFTASKQLFYGCNGIFQVQKRITSFEDIVEVVNTYISQDAQATIVSEAKAGLYEFIEGSKDFCKAGCIKKSAKFFKHVFSATHDEETCPTIEVYCGGCQANTDQYLSDTAGSVPCCTQDALDSIVGVSLC